MLKWLKHKYEEMDAVRVRPTVEAPHPQSVVIRLTHLRGLMEERREELKKLTGVYGLYKIYEKDGMYYAENLRTEKVDFCGVDAAWVIQCAIDQSEEE